MADFFVDEDFSHRVVKQLRLFGHDVLTIQAAGYANLGFPDNEVVKLATFLNRTILTFNGKDFERLHWFDDQHAGIIICTQMLQPQELAQRIDAIAQTESPLAGKLLEVA